MTMKLLKDLSLEGITQIQALMQYVLGNINLDLYFPVRVYNIGDYAIHATGSSYEVVKCTVNGTTGAYNSNNWTVVNPLKTKIDCGTF